MNAQVLDVLRAFAWLFIVTVVFVPVEWFFPIRKPESRRRTLPSDLVFFFVSNFVPPLLLLLPLTAVAWVAYHLVPGRLHRAVEAWPLWLRGVSAFVVADLGFYWGHRWTHRFPLLWRFHAVHHAPEHVYFLISARAHPIDNAFIRFCGLAPIYVLGLGAPQSVQGTLIATLLMIALTMWGFFIHANVRWRFGPLERLVATPFFHLWHHTRSGLRDRNFASMLPVWDMAFDTCHLPEAEWPRDFGVDQPLAPSVLGQLVDPIARWSPRRSPPTSGAAAPT